MKLNLISDLHTELPKCVYTHNLVELDQDVDMILYAGDMGERFYEEIYECDDMYFGCKGNHDFYRNTDFIVTGRVDVRVKGDYVFLATTLWTDFNLTHNRVLDMIAVQRKLNDYQYIQMIDRSLIGKVGFPYRLIIPEDILKEHRLAKRELQKLLNKYKDKKCVVITHHAPSGKSTCSKYLGCRLNSPYMSNMDKFILRNPQIVLWHHGHIHSSAFYKIGNCQVVANPRGVGEKCQNKDFKPDLCINI